MARNSLFAYSVMAQVVVLGGAPLSKVGDCQSPPSLVPLAAVFQASPWKLFPDSYRPLSLVYDDGTVIYLEAFTGPSVYRIGKLDEDDLTQLKRRCDALSGFRPLSDNYDFHPNWTDQPRADLYLTIRQRAVVTSIRGLRTDALSDGNHVEIENGDEARPPPQELLDLHRYLLDVRPSSSKEWTADTYEIVLWQFANARKRPVDWPLQWPTIGSEFVSPLGQGYSVTLTDQSKSTIEAFILRLKNGRPVKFAGKPMAAAYRPVFPGASILRNAFDESARRNSIDK